MVCPQPLSHSLLSTPHSLLFTFLAPSSPASQPVIHVLYVLLCTMPAKQARLHLEFTCHFGPRFMASLFFSYSVAPRQHSKEQRFFLFLLSTDIVFEIESLSLTLETEPPSSLDTITRTNMCGLISQSRLRPYGNTLPQTPVFTLAPAWKKGKARGSPYPPKKGADWTVSPLPSSNLSEGDSQSQMKQTWRWRKKMGTFCGSPKNPILFVRRGAYLDLAKRTFCLPPPSPRPLSRQLMTNYGKRRREDWVAQTQPLSPAVRRRKLLQTHESSPP